MAWNVCLSLFLGFRFCLFSRVNLSPYVTTITMDSKSWNTFLCLRKLWQLLEMASICLHKILLAKTDQLIVK
jgi:hypothetical protein